VKELDFQELSEIELKNDNTVLSFYLSKNVSLHDSKSLTDRWKLLLLEAEFLLLKKYPRNYVNEFLKDIWSIKVADFFESIDEGIAVFLSAELNEGKPVFCRINTRTLDSIHVGNRLNLKPLSKVLSPSKGFFIVTMTSRAINVLIENKGHLVKIDSYRNEPGIDKMNKKDHHEFFLNASCELNKLFKAYRLPIVLAGVKAHLGKMRKLLNHSMLLERAIVGNVEKMKAIELQRKVYQIYE